MALSLILAGLWLAVACAVGLVRGPLPQPMAWGLIALGVPLLGFVTLIMGPVWGMIGLILGAVMLRRPIQRAGLWQGSPPHTPEIEARSGD